MLNDGNIFTVAHKIHAKHDIGRPDRRHPARAVRAAHQPLHRRADHTGALSQPPAGAKGDTLHMSRHDKLYGKVERNPDNVKWKDFCVLCTHYFGKPLRQRGSHITYALPSWADHGTLTIQPRGKQAKGYQVRQALRHIERIRGGHS